MSQIDPSSGNEQSGELIVEKSSDNDDNYETEEEELSENSGISSKKKKKKNNFKKRTMKLQRLTISLRNRKSSWESKTKKQIQKIGKKRIKKERKMSNVLKKKISEKNVETPKLGKRCRFGGKAKGKPPPVEETQDKHDSDDDSDSAYLSRISLGQYQQLRDRSGASTSYQTDEEEYNYNNLSHNKNHDEYSEEEELRELQSWGRNVLNTYYCVLRNWRNYRELFEHVNK